MLADYTSYLEFIGAVYFTMSLSEYLTTKIWSPKDARKLKWALDGLGMSDDKDFEQAVLYANKKKGEVLQKELSKKSLIGLFIVAYLLIFCGVEQGLDREGNKELLELWQLELAYTCVYFLFTMVTLQWVLFYKWKYVVFYIISILAVFLLIHWKEFVLNCFVIEKYCVQNIGFVVCITISIPILWQIFITWIHKSVFYGYVKSKIRDAQKEYNRVLEDVHNKQFDNLPKRYHEIYMRISQASEDKTPRQALEDSLSDYKGVLYNDIRTIGLNVKLYQLFFSWVKFRAIFFINWIKGVFSRKNSKQLGVKTYADYAVKFKQQKSFNKSLKMKDFCDNEKIDFDEFARYYHKYCLQ